MGGGNSKNKVGLEVIAEEMKIRSYLHVEGCPCLQDVS